MQFIMIQLKYCENKVIGVYNFRQVLSNEDLNITLWLDSKAYAFLSNVVTLDYLQDLYIIVSSTKMEWCYKTII